MTQKILVALGGNAILTDDPSATAQQAALATTAKQLVQFIENGNQLIISHGNGPQVGNLLLQQEAGSNKDNPAMPLDTIGAMTQGEIGYWLQSAFSTALQAKGIEKAVISIITRTLVSSDDPAFLNPSKPIGPFYSQDQIEAVQKEHPDWTIVEDAGRGYRRVVASPQPIDILEGLAIKQSFESGIVTIAAGGGGIPVIKTGDSYQGVQAVIDKDLSSQKLAEITEVDQLIILTAVENVYINYNQSNQEKLTKVTVAELEKLILDNQFAAGSMLPKIQAAIKFVKATGKRAVITSLENISGYLQAESGTIIEG